MTICIRTQCISWELWQKRIFHWQHEHTDKLKLSRRDWNVYALLCRRMQRSWTMRCLFLLLYFFKPFIGCLSADGIAPHNKTFSGQILSSVSLDAQLRKLYITFVLASFRFPWKAGLEPLISSIQLCPDCGVCGVLPPHLPSCSAPACNRSLSSPLKGIFLFSLAQGPSWGFALIPLMPT